MFVGAYCLHFLRESVFRYQRDHKILWRVRKLINSLKLNLLLFSFFLDYHIAHVQKQLAGRSNLTLTMDCIDCIFFLMEETEEIRPIVFIENLPDLFAALFELSHLSEGIQKASPSSIFQLSNISTPDFSSFASSRLSKLLNLVPVELIFESLTLLLSSPSCPTWMRKICGEILSGILPKPMGVKTVLNKMISSSNSNWILAAQKIATLLSKVPKQMTKEVPKMELVFALI